MPVTNTPLRYPGGKSQMLPVVIDILKKNDLICGEYAEPFAGGSGLPLSLVMHGYVSRAYINDIDFHIHSFWHSVLNDSERLCAMINDVNVTIDEWHQQRAIFQEGESDDLLRAGFSALFLNRTNRSGILRGGVIGGLQQDGNYKLDCRFNKQDLIRKIKRIAMYKDAITLTRLDALCFLEEIAPAMGKYSLINLDPPYYKKGQELYTSFYAPKDHAVLAKSVSRLKKRWIVTYDNAEEIRALYQKFPMSTNSLNYSAQVKKIGVELMINHPKLDMPILN